MKKYISQEEYIMQIIDRLKNNGYGIKNQIKENIPNESFTFISLAKKTEFALIRFGFFSTIFVISRSANPSISDLINYSSVCYKIAKKSTPLLPPRSFMYSFLCFSCVIAEELDDETCISIKQLDIPKHWAATERLVVYNVADSQLYYSEKRPLWGGFYHGLDESVINYLLCLEG
ncbi:hypothetical protein JXI42_10840 [bacterium]|nr:hypothetical protein [bacterium]